MGESGHRSVRVQWTAILGTGWLSFQFHWWCRCRQPVRLQWLKYLSPTLLDMWFKGAGIEFGVSIHVSWVQAVCRWLGLPTLQIGHRSPLSEWQSRVREDCEEQIKWPFRWECPVEALLQLNKRRGKDYLSVPLSVCFVGKIALLFLAVKLASLSLRNNMWCSGAS